MCHFPVKQTSTSAITLERTIYVDHWFNILRLFVYNTIIIYFILLGGVAIGTLVIAEFSSDFYPEVYKKYFTLKPLLGNLMLLLLLLLLF